MPLFYFHLGLGNRILCDDEGTELGKPGGSPCRGAGHHPRACPTAASCSSGHPTDWFLRVADADGQFLHLPIDRPALEVVAADHAPAPQPPPTTARAGESASPLSGRMAEVLARLLEGQRRTSELLQRNQQLRGQLSSELQACQRIRQQSADLLAYARTLNFAWAPRGRAS